MSDYNDGLIPEPCLRLDYGFGQQYASVELGDGTGYVRVTDDLRSEHHKMKRWYDDELRAALDSNDELRMKVVSLEAALEGMHLIREQDKAENDKLRELVEDMLSCIEIQIAFDRTPEKWMYKEFAGRAQELGIEED